MALGARIEERRLALGISQAELARLAGVPQTTMNGLIRGSSRTTPHLIRIARALRTTPAYLMAETDDPATELPVPVFSLEELELITLLRGISPKSRQALLHFARIASKQDNRTTLATGDADPVNRTT